MKILMALFAATSILISGYVYAAPVAGVGHGNSGFGHATGSMPPGLQNKGTPPGLKMQNKTPAGWSRGVKKGWTKSHRVHHRHTVTHSSTKLD